jgi:uncharacterized protein YukE
VVTFLNFIGIKWPMINEDTVRDVATMIQQFAQDVQNTHQDATNQIHAMSEAYQGASYEKLVSEWQSRSNTHMTELMDVCQAIVDALQGFADYIVVQKGVAIGELWRWRRRSWRRRRRRRSPSVSPKLPIWGWTNWRAGDQPAQAADPAVHRRQGHPGGVQAARPGGRAGGGGVGLPLRGRWAPRPAAAQVGELMMVDAPALLQEHAQLMQHARADDARARAEACRKARGSGLHVSEGEGDYELAQMPRQAPSRCSSRPSRHGPCPGEGQRVGRPAPKSSHRRTRARQRPAHGFQGLHDDLGQTAAHPTLPSGIDPNARTNTRT